MKQRPVLDYARRDPPRQGPPNRRPWIFLGIVLFCMGAAMELWVFLQQAWPTACTWVLMLAGAAITTLALAWPRPRQ